MKSAVYLINILIYFFGAPLHFRCSFNEFQRLRVLLSLYPPLRSAHYPAPGNPARGGALGFQIEKEPEQFETAENTTISTGNTVTRKDY
jgi:hypothetical protein